MNSMISYQNMNFQKSNFHYVETFEDEEKIRNPNFTILTSLTT